MFTGIIQTIGLVKQIQKADVSSLIIEAKQFLEDVKIGDSIAVNGVCLTVVELLNNTFKVDVMPETMNRSSLSALSINSKVNLEKALGVNTKLDGHFVQGHIDGVAKIKSIQNLGSSKLITFSCTDDLTKFMVEKGSIALDGISLTLVSVSATEFQVGLIPHSSLITSLGEKTIGDLVNVEVDILGKYVYKMLGKQDSKNKLTEEFLYANGF